jgi:hypothetical protein
MDSFNNLKLPLDYKTVKYRRTPDPQFDITNPNLLGEMYNDKMDENKHDLGFLNKFGWKHFAWAFYKLLPGKWLPPHVDHFENYTKHYNIKDKTKIKRSIVFLEDWRPGHVFCLENRIILNWRAGDYYTWRHDASHWGGNFGDEARYTLQLTGVYE